MLLPDDDFPVRDHGTSGRDDAERDAEWMGSRLLWLTRWLRERGTETVGHPESEEDVVQEMGLCLWRFRRRAGRRVRGLDEDWLEEFAERLWKRIRARPDREVRIEGLEDHADFRGVARDGDPMLAESLSCLERALSDLTAAQREVVLEPWVEGRSTAEVARARGCSENAVRLLRSRGLTKLRRALESELQSASRKR